MPHPLAPSQGMTQHRVEQLGLDCSIPLPRIKGTQVDLQKKLRHKCQFLLECKLKDNFNLNVNLNVCQTLVT